METALAASDLMEAPAEKVAEAVAQTAGSQSTTMKPPPRSSASPSDVRYFFAGNLTDVALKAWANDIAPANENEGDVANETTQNGRPSHVADPPCIP